MWDGGFPLCSPNAIKVDEGRKSFPSGALTPAGFVRLFLSCHIEHDLGMHERQRRVVCAHECDWQACRVLRSHVLEHIRLGLPVILAGGEAARLRRAGKPMAAHRQFSANDACALDWDDSASGASLAGIDELLFYHTGDGNASAAFERRILT